MESEILKYETQDKALHIADVMGCTISEIEVENCPYCKKRSYFKKDYLKNMLKDMVLENGIFIVGV